MPPSFSSKTQLNHGPLLTLRAVSLSLPLAFSVFSSTTSPPPPKRIPFSLKLVNPLSFFSATLSTLNIISYGFVAKAPFVPLARLAFFLLSAYHIVLLFVPVDGPVNYALLSYYLSTWLNRSPLSIPIQSILFRASSCCHFFPPNKFIHPPRFPIPAS
ncbi:uncharacterized protein BO72DRAFT_35780 [Aspergillus fijiensis CBS 313.89]|uniref:Uncharacterized protein n=1 Tax=Aspergillus fijiensis CBS 313.89 TaxID=1448319 RepID=A0A8G1RV08_9EURO|nr:uncharacterized protein BO72DRAFT_35780 [Aspergillus fijiensis CBS 313.89]RAK79749.1 hypothetical protein BO72DRAFT_35780 [Aspergillus fijiensis CBS 313.89]